MKLIQQAALALLTALIATGCGSSYNCDDVVQESYIHKYGIPVTKTDWKAKGASGKVVTKLKDGVTVTQTYDRDVLHGETTYSFPHTDTVSKAEVYNYGTLVAQTSMYVSGTPEKETEMHHDGQSTVKTWYENGVPRSIEELDGNTIISGQYFKPDNSLESEVLDLGGMRVNRDAYGMLLSRDTITNGVLTLRTKYHNNGTPKELIPYRNDVVHGMKRSFLASGEPDRIEHWVQGKHTGVTVFYSNGEKVSEVEYVSGARHGIEKKFRDGTQVVEEISWLQDKRHGPTRVYLSSGPKTDWYHDGKLVSKFAYDELNRKAHR